MSGKAGATEILPVMLKAQNHCKENEWISSPKNLFNSHCLPSRFSHHDLGSGKEGPVHTCQARCEGCTIHHHLSFQMTWKWRHQASGLSKGQWQIIYAVTLQKWHGTHVSCTRFRHQSAFHVRMWWHLKQAWILSGGDSIMCLRAEDADPTDASSMHPQMAQLASIGSTAF